jgi:hypothetical protein
LEERQLLAVAALPLYATFDQHAWLGIAPPTGGENEPTSIVTPSGGSVAIVASSDTTTSTTTNGITTQPVRIIDTGSANYGSVDFDFAPVTTESVRAEATVSFSRLVDGYFLQIGDGDHAVQLRMTSSGKITDSSFNVLGDYQVNVAFRVRLTVSPDSDSWAVTVDNELDGFDNDAPYTGLLYSYSTVSRFSLSLCTTVGSATTNVAYDDVKISAYSDLVVSNITPIYYDATRSQLTYQYTIKNLGDSPADIEGDSSTTTDNVLVQGILSANDVLGDGDDVAAGTAVLYGNRSGLLESNETLTGTIDASASVSGSANPYVFLIVDSTYLLTESDETNNVGSAAIPDAGALSILSTYDHEPLDVTPLTGGLNQPTSTSASTSTSVVTVEDASCGLTSRVLQIANANNTTTGQTGEVTYTFDTLWNGVVRVEATVGFSALTASTFLVAMDQYGSTVFNLQTTSGGIIIDNNSVTMGRYSANTPFRIRMDIDMSSKSWTFIQDTERDGFDDNTVITSRPFGTNITEINRIRTQLYTAANAGAMTAAFDDIVIAQADLVVSNVRAINYTNDYIEYEYTITNVGGVEANLNGASSGVAADEVQQLTFTTRPAGGNYAITFDLDGVGGSSPAQTVSNVLYSSTAASIQSALWGLSTIGSGAVLVQGSYTTGFTFTFTRARGATNLLSTVLAVNTSGLTGVGGGSVGSQIDTLVDGHTYNTAYDNVTLNVVMSTNDVYGDADDLTLTGVNLYSANAASASGAIILAPGESYTGLYQVSATVDTAAYPNLVFNVDSRTTNEEQELTFTTRPTGGTYSLTFDADGYAAAYSPATTASLSYSANAAQVQTALAALSTIGADNVLVTGSYTAGFHITFVGDWGAQNILDTALRANTGALTSATGSVSYEVDTVDDGYRVGSSLESNTANNSLSATIPSVGTFDLSGALCDAPTAVVWGQTISVSFQVANAGTGALVADSMQRFYLSADTSYGSGDVPLGSAVLTDDIAAGGTSTVNTVALTLPTSLPSGFSSTGPFYILMVTDTSTNVVETDESNNRPPAAGAGRDYDALDIVTGPNLTGALFTVPDNLCWGQTFTLQCAVAETNGIAVATDLAQAIYLSQDAVFGNSDDVLLGTLTYPADIAGGSVGSTLNGSITMPASAPAGYTQFGTFYLGMYTDAANAVTESNETDNLPFSNGEGHDSSVFALVDIDLRGAACEVPGELSWGQPFVISYAVANAGSDPVTDSFVQTFYLSTDAVWDANDTVLAVATCSADVPASGTSGTLTQWVQMPSTAPGGFSGNGPYYVLMVTDSTGLLGETNETNNKPTSVATLGQDLASFVVPSDLPDLAGAQCYPPTKIEWGASFIVNYQVVNHGSAAVTSDFQQSFVLSADRTFGDGDDVALGSATVTVDVAAYGTSLLLSINLTLPAAAPAGYTGEGPFYIGMYTDAGETVWESNETNNQPLTSGLGCDWQFFYIGTGGDTPLTTPTTLGLFEPSSSAFSLRTENTSGDADITFTFNQAGDGRELLIGDWDGNGTTDVGYYDPASSRFYLTAAYDGSTTYSFGYGVPNAGWIPVVGDWDGDGKDGVGLYDPAASMFFLTNALETGVAQHCFGYGVPGNDWEPLVGDWDGDGAQGVGLYDPHASTFYLTDTLATGYAEHTFGYGQAGGGWQPLVGDWNGDLADGVGLFDAQGSTFYLTDAFVTGYAQYTFGYGVANGGWDPLIGDWNGDGADGVGLYDGTTSTFYLTNTLQGGYAQYTVEFGQANAGLVPFVGTWVESNASTRSPSVVSATAVDQIDLASVAEQELTDASPTDVSGDATASALAIDVALAEL